MLSDKAKKKIVEFQKRRDMIMTKLNDEQKIMFSYLLNNLGMFNDLESISAYSEVEKDRVQIVLNELRELGYVNCNWQVEGFDEEEDHT